MSEFEVTKIGERGQVVIPLTCREDMGLNKGDKFIVLHIGDTILLKRLLPPSKEEFEHMLAKGHAHAKKHNLNKEDMWSAIAKARRK